MADTVVTPKGYFGLSNVHIAWLTDETTPTWATPVALPGAVELKLKATSSSTDFYADDSVWYTGYSNQGFDGDAVFFNLPLAILAQMLGGEVDTNGGLVGLTDGIPAPFALMAEQKSSDGNPKSTVYYKCTASRPDDDKTTKEDKVDLTKTSLSIKAVPMVIGGKKMDHYTLPKTTANAAVYATFMTAVCTPNKTVA